MEFSCADTAADHDDTARRGHIWRAAQGMGPSWGTSQGLHGRGWASRDRPCPCGRLNAYGSGPAGWLLRRDGQEVHGLDSPGQPGADGREPQKATSGPACSLRPIRHNPSAFCATRRPRRRCRRPCGSTSRRAHGATGPPAWFSGQPPKSTHSESPESTISTWGKIRSTLELVGSKLIEGVH